jgi:CHASE2 domain-containing sensor protein
MWGTQMDEHSSTSSNRGRGWGLRLLIFLLALFVPVVEHAEELVERGICGTRPGLEMFLSRTGVAYLRVAAAGYRKPRSHWVTLVVLKKGSDPEDVLSNICKQRLYLAKLLATIQIAKPSLIVVDKYFAGLSCTDESANEALRAAFSASSVPMIVGLHTETRQDFEKDLDGVLTEPQKKAFDAACLYLTPALSLDEPGVQTPTPVRYGLLRMNEDTRKLPLTWPTYFSKEDVGTKAPMVLPSLSLVAASVVDTTADGLQRIERLRKRTTHPFTSFIPLGQIPTYSALDLICDTKQARSVQWDDCPLQNTNASVMNGRIVMIGEDVPDIDQHDTEIGRVPGVILQANYLESILDDRYLEPVPLGLAVSASLVWLALIEFVFWNMHSPELAFIATLLLTVILWFFCYILAVLTGYFLSVWIPGSFYLLARWIVARAHAWSHA